MANEDTTFEFELASTSRCKHILAVGGSGSRCLPFLANDIESLHIVDVSKEQLLLIQFKIESIKQLQRNEAIELWTSHDRERRTAILEKLKLGDEISSFARFMNENPLPFLYQGSWEKTFKTFSKLTKILFGEKVLKGLFESTHSYEYFQKNIKGLRWDALIRIVGNKAMFNSLLYKGNFIQKNSPLTYFQYYSNAFERLFRLNVSKSHFMQICLLGEVVFKEGLPIEFSEKLFNRIKESKVTPIYLQGSIFDQKYSQEFDFISLSDVPSYLSSDIEKNYIQKLRPVTQKDGLIVNRFYLRKTENTNEAGFTDVTQDYNVLIQQELVQMYDIQVLKYVS